MLGHLAAAQLAAWEEIATSWGVGPSGECGRCGKGIILLIDRYGHPYRYTDEQWLALVVLHLRNHHEDLDPNG